MNCCDTIREDKRIEFIEQIKPTREAGVICTDDGT